MLIYLDLVSLPCGRPRLSVFPYCGVRWPGFPGVVYYSDGVSRYLYYISDASSGGVFLYRFILGNFDGGVAADCGTSSGWGRCVDLVSSGFFLVRFIWVLLCRTYRGVLPGCWLLLLFAWLASWGSSFRFRRLRIDCFFVPYFMGYLYGGGSIKVVMDAVVPGYGGAGWARVVSGFMLSFIGVGVGVSDVAEVVPGAGFVRPRRLYTCLRISSFVLSVMIQCPRLPYQSLKRLSFRMCPGVVVSGNAGDRRASGGVGVVRASSRLLVGLLWELGLSSGGPCPCSGHCGCRAWCSSSVSHLFVSGWDDYF